MTAFVPVAHVGDLTDNSDTAVSTSAITLQTGVFRILNADDRSMHFSWGGAPDASSDALHVNVAAGSEVFVKLAKPKNVKISGVSVHATAPVITVEGGSTSGNSTFVVGDYVTLTGAAVSGYNTQIAHAEVTAVDAVTGAITVSADTSALAAFTGTAQLYRSFKISAQGDTSNGLTVYIDEIQLLG